MSRTLISLVVSGSLAASVVVLSGQAPQRPDFTGVWTNYTAPGALSEGVTRAIHAETGHKPKFSTGGGTSDGRFIATLGAQVVELGVINATIHKVNESVNVADIDRLHGIYLNALKEMLA